MPTVLEIAQDAIAKAEAAIPGSTKSYSLTEDVISPTYDTATGSYPVTPTIVSTCSGVVDTVTPIADIFPDYKVGKSDTLIFLIGYTTIPKEGMKINDGTIVRTIKAAQDTLDNGTIGYVVAI